MDANHSQGEVRVPPRTYLLWIAIIGLIPLLVIFRQSATNEGPLLSQHQFMQLLTNDQIAAGRITLDPQSPQFHDVRGAYFKVDSSQKRVVQDGEHVKVPFRTQIYLTDRDLQDLLNRPAFHATRPNTLLLNIVWSLGPILLVALLIYLVLIRQLKSAASRQPLAQRKPPSEFAGIVHIDPQIVQRAPVFVGTDVPLQRLIDALERGESIERFLTDNPSVKRSQVVAVIEAGRQKMLETLR